MKSYNCQKIRHFCKQLFRAKKLLSILAIFVPMTKKDHYVAITKVPYIYYLFCFCNNTKNKIYKALINSGNKVNAMTMAYISKLDFKNRQHHKI